MSIQIQGYAGAVIGEGGSAQLVSKSLKVQSMPPEFGALGHYAKALLTGTMAAGLAAAATIWSMRWNDATRFALVRRVSIEGFGVATGFAAGFWNFQLKVLRAYSAVDTAGTVATLTGDQAKLRTSMGTPLLGEMGISTTAIRTVGTRTAETNASGIASGSIGTGGDAKIFDSAVLFDARAGEHPIVLAGSGASAEGLAILATVPATGTWQAGVSCLWGEVAAY